MSRLSMNISEEEADFDVDHNVTSLSCGEWDDVVDSCSFWMEGILITITGKNRKDRFKTHSLNIYNMQ